MLFKNLDQNGRFTTNGEFYEGKHPKFMLEEVILLHLKGCFTPLEPIFSVP